VLPTNDAVTNAYRLLSDVVREFYSGGRPCLGATLKPELYRKANFSELQLGFPRFGDFLRAANAAGYVQLSPTPGGDIAVLPIGVRIPAAQTRGYNTQMWLGPSAQPAAARPWPVASPAPLRVRQDLWNAFNSFSTPWVYDAAADLAYRESQVPKGDLDTSGERSRPDLIRIPFGRDRVVEWMRSFTNMQDTETRERLSPALEGDGTPFQFNNLVRSDSRLWRAWRRYHVQQVLAAIDAWAASNNVHPKGLMGSAYWPARQSASPATLPVPPAMAAVREVTPSVSQPALPALTTKLESLIDELIDELVKLRGFLQLVPPKQ
jgi:hypothetical protein